MASSYTLRFPSAAAPTTSSTRGALKLVELPSEILKIIEDRDEQALAQISIRGRTTDDAVLCTKDRTYTLRSVQVSNSYLVLTGPSIDPTSDESEWTDSLVLRDQVNEILETVPMVPKLDRLTSLLRENEYKPEEEDDDEEEDLYDAPPRKRQRFTYDQVRGLIQASDTELDRGLREKRVLQVDGNLQPLPPTQLAQILSLILTLVISNPSLRSSSLSSSPKNVPLSKLAQELRFEHNINEDVTKQVCAWFGEISGGEDGGGKWDMDSEVIVREIGLGVLIENRHQELTEPDILKAWKNKIGDTFESIAKLPLLAGNYVQTSSESSTSVVPKYRYFPASALPTNPAQRFADLFLTRKSWTGEELVPFLQDIALDTKERDKLLVKFTRKSTNAQRITVYSSRAKY